MSMSGTPIVHITSLFGLFGFLLLWIMLFECAHLLVTLLRNDQLIGWAISPIGVTTLWLQSTLRPLVSPTCVITSTSPRPICFEHFDRWLVCVSMHAVAQFDVYSAA